MKKLNKLKGVDERLLFHGTSPSHMSAICEQNFDWRLCGTHGTMYGKGTSAEGCRGWSSRGCKPQLGWGMWVRSDWWFLTHALLPLGHSHLCASALLQVAPTAIPFQEGLKTPLFASGTCSWTGGTWRLMAKCELEFVSALK